MADEYIKKSDALKAMEWKWAGKEAFEAVDALPAADVAPVVHGKWVPDVYAKDERTGYEYLVFKCSVCGCGCAIRNNYCHNCGAAMDGAE